MNIFGFIGAVLVALLAMLLPALAHKEHWNVMRESWRSPLRLVMGVFAETLGTITVTYYLRGGVTRLNGSVTPPTASQASEVYKQSALVVFGVAGDPASALFTHNWGLDASAATYFEPEVFIEPVSLGTTSWPLFTFSRANTNVLSINRNAGDTATTILVTLRRPQSVGQ